MAERIRGKREREKKRKKIIKKEKKEKEIEKRVCTNFNQPWKATKMKIIIGIDPGLTGGIAILESTSKQIMKLVDMPTSPDGKKRKVNGYGLMNIFGGYNRHEIEMVYLERVGARPGQGVVSMFSFGRSYGAVEAAVSFLGFPLTYVTPQRWKRSAGLIGAQKDASRGKVLDLYPEADVHRKKDNGRADAVLIARYGESQ